MDQEIVIINPQTLTVCSSDQVGEICVSGPSVAAGYWNRPADTEYAFKCRPIGAADKRFLRTGDLGFMQDGELFVTGRLKDLLIIGGSNYYPQDIELTTERSHKNLRPASCAAFSIDVASEERLVVVIEVERHHLPDDQNGECSVASRRQRLSVSGAKDIVMAIQRAVAEEHELQVHQVVLLKAGSIFKTSSGKIQRHLCRKAFLASDLDVWG
jgi:acyl-CoA synthetase (AMP-forming)/AMP-acid ligase II